MKKFLPIFCALICALSLGFSGCSSDNDSKQAPDPGTVTQDDNNPDDCDKQPCPDDKPKIRPDFKFRPHRDIGKRKGDGNTPKPPQPPQKPLPRN